jgi:apolipoprotein D and lipocalin family protein
MGCSSASKITPVEHVPHVEVDRYVGHWYEIARYPNVFEEDAIGVTADYTIREDGKIEVLNQCWRKTFDSKRDSVNGVARIVDEESNAQLKVSFFWPFWGHYWIIDLDSSYNWTVVGHPKDKYLWILSRDKFMDDELYYMIVKRLEERGLDVSRLEKTLHSNDIEY